MGDTACDADHQAVAEIFEGGGDVAGDDSSGGSAVYAEGETGNGNVVAVNGAQGVDVVVIGAGRESGMQLVEGCFGGSHLQGEGANPSDGVVGVGEGHIADIYIGGPGRDS